MEILSNILVNDYENLFLFFIWIGWVSLNIDRNSVYGDRPTPIGSSGI